jgi:hypothetical protein
MINQQPLQILQLLLAKSHDLAGLVALALGLFAMAVPKQGIGHRRSGRIAMIAMVILIALALVLLLTYLLPDSPSRGQGPQLLFYLLVVAWISFGWIPLGVHPAELSNSSMGFVACDSGLFRGILVSRWVDLGYQLSAQLQQWIDGGCLRIRAHIHTQWRRVLVVCG